jgi:hypothetical protein
MPEVHEYKTYLAAGHPVVEEEGRFLDVVDDLAKLNIPQDVQGGLMSETVYTPMPRSTKEEVGFPPGHQVSDTKDQKHSQRGATEPPASIFVHFMLAMIAAVLAPILTFLVIPNFVGRMTVVLLVWSGALTALMQTGVLDQLMAGGGIVECVVATTVYGVAMAVIASVVD